MPSLSYSYDNHWILVLTTLLDCAVQTVVPNALCPRLVYLSHYAKLAGHSGERRLHDTMRRELYWLHMASIVYIIINDGCDCARNRVSLKRKCHLKRIPAHRPLKFIAMEILGPLPKTNTGNEFIIFITDLYEKLTRAILSMKTIEPHVASIFSDH